MTKPRKGGGKRRHAHLRVLVKKAQLHVYHFGLHQSAAFYLSPGLLA
jgi:hypothetical protein